MKEKLKYNNIFAIYEIESNVSSATTANQEELSNKGARLSDSGCHKLPLHLDSEHLD